MAMLTILFYESDQIPATTIDELAEILETIPGLTFEARPGAPYRPARWRDAATGARALWDLGQPTLKAHEDQPGADDKIRTYSGWRQVPLVLQVPLAGPHWHAVMALAQVDRVLKAAVQLMPLEREDDRRDAESDAGPYAWDRPRVIANWDTLRAVQVADLSLPHLDRRVSVALWRYRVERAAGRKAHPDYHWPEALTLLDQATNQVRTACLWSASDEAFALPPVDVVVIRGGVVPADELRLLAGATVHGGAQLITNSPAVINFYTGAKLLPAERFTALGDEDWAD